MGVAKRELAEKFRREADAALDEAARKRDAANYQQLMVGAGISADKSQLLDGEPTSITREVEGQRASVLSAFEHLATVVRERYVDVPREVVAARLLEAAPASSLPPGTREWLYERLCEQMPELRALLPECPPPA